MPIVVKEATWSDTGAEIHVTVPLKGVRADKTSIYTNDSFVRVSFPPYIYEADLYAAIDDIASVASIGNGAAVLRLVKVDSSNTWPALYHTGDREEIKTRRADAEARALERAKALEEKKKEEENEKRRQAVDRQMQLEAKDRDAIQAKKDAERRIVDSDMAELEKKTEAKAAAAPKDKSKDIFEDKPPVRQTAKIAVSFTKRDFKTPQRETYKEQEEEWMRKQAAARAAVQRAKESQPGDVEHDPLWYKDRGLEFFKNGDFDSAINAFTAGLTLDPNSAPLYSNRAACHLKHGDYGACAVDCGKALSLLTPPVPENAKSRLLAHVRRGAALALLGDYASAEVDYKHALAIDPENASLQNDLAEVRMKMLSEGSKPVSRVEES